jgi:DNA-directed RNA polymerase subunit RPC12/RpoP
MGTYRFECKKCKKEYYDMCPYDETGKYTKVKCPECGSKSKTQLITTCNFNFSNPVGTDRWTSDSTGHDYRFKHNIPNVQKEREMAEALSHMGASPYKDNSASDIDMDTGIHDAPFRSGLS